MENKASCGKCGKRLINIKDIKKHKCPKIRQCFHYFVSNKISWVGIFVLVSVAFSELNTLIKIITYIGFFMLEDFIKAIVGKFDVKGGISE